MRSRKGKSLWRSISILLQPCKGESHRLTWPLLLVLFTALVSLLGASYCYTLYHCTSQPRDGRHRVLQLPLLLLIFPLIGSATRASPAMGERDIELGRLHADTTAAYGPQHYFQEVNELGALLNNTANMVQNLKETNLELSSISGSAAMKEIEVKIQKEIDQVRQMAHNMKEKLNRIFQSALTPIQNNLSNGRGYPPTLQNTMDPTALSMTIALKKKFKERENDLKNLRKTIWEEYLEVVQRRTFTVTGTKLSDEVVRVIDTGSIVQMFENAVQGVSPEQVVPAMDEIEERHAAAMDFDKKILELQQNFAEMAALLETREKMDKALNQVRKFAIRARSTQEDARSTQEELLNEMAKKDRLLEEKDLHLAIVIGLRIALCAVVIFLFV